MKLINKKNVIYTLLMIIFGVAVNRGISYLSGVFGLPLYLDSIGTMFIAALGGTFPGMVVGFVSNMIGGIRDTSTFYYGTINVLIAFIAGTAAKKGRFDKIYDVILLAPFYLILSVPCSFLTYILFSFKIGDNVAGPMVTMLHSKGIPILLAQILGDFTVEFPDKLISLMIAFLMLKLVPTKWRKLMGIMSGREYHKYMSEEDLERRSSLRIQIGIWLMIAGLLIVLVAFIISYKTYMEARVEGFPDEPYDIALLKTETMLYSCKMLSAVLGLLMCIVSFAMVLADKVVVAPLHLMAKEMRRFAYDSDSGRDRSVEKIKALEIHTGNEIEELYVAMSKTVEDIDDYIDKTNEQANTISDLHVNIITTLADIVEGRDETTGFHVKRTAEYCSLIAKELRDSDIYSEELTDDFIDTLTIAAPLHDIGKIRIPDAILNKPGRLDPEEFDVIKTHTTEGYKMLEKAKATLGETEYLEMAQDIAYGHHEWWDGSEKGYPRGLSGEDIPLSARIMAVADVFDALVSKRPYKDGFPLDKAFGILQEESGTHFDPEVVEALIRKREEARIIMEKYKD